MVSQLISRLATSLRGQGGFNVANLLLDSGELLARFESSGATVSLEKEHSTAVHTNALLQYFFQTVKLFQPIGAIVDPAAAEEVLQPLQQWGIPTRVLSHELQAGSDLRPGQVESILEPFLQERTVVSGKPESADAKVATRLRQESRKRVFFLSPSWEVSGVNTFTELLCRELNNRDYDASILLTDNVAMALPPERLPRVPYRFLHATRPPNSVKNARLAEFLSGMGPAVVVPNFDYRSSSVSAILPDSVRTLGILHSDDVDHYTHAYRMGHSWERIVSVSATIQRKLLLLNPAFESKSLTINYGVDAPAELVNKANQREKIEKLRIVYSGRLVQQQKRILDFADLLQSLQERGVPFEFTMIGDGQEADELRQLAAPFVDSGQLRMLGRLQPHEIYAELVEHHVICLMSDYEGLPLSLLEGLACGCVPIMTQIESGVSEILDHERNALMSPLRSPSAMADNMHRLYCDNALRKRLADAARPTLESNRLTSLQMVDQYEEVLSQLFDSIGEASANTIPPYWRCNCVDRLLNAA